jgi:ketosteroid isomerase-like protein
MSINHEKNEEEKIVEDEVLRRSEKWIASFNSGDVDACVVGYTKSAVMNAKPMGVFTGLKEIEGFWRPFIESGAGNLVYKNIKLEIVDDKTALLSADWSMNVGRGIITMEKWVKLGEDWFLERDDFEVKEKFS